MILLVNFELFFTRKRLRKLLDFLIKGIPFYICFVVKYMYIKYEWMIHKKDNVTDNYMYIQFREGKWCATGKTLVLVGSIPTPTNFRCPLT